jgi:hypothetical protein
VSEYDFAASTIAALTPFSPLIRGIEEAAILSLSPVFVSKI